MGLRWRGLAVGLAYRGLLRRVDRLIDTQQEQNRLLARLVDRFAPSIDLPVPVPAAPAPRDHLRLSSTDRGDISHLDPAESELAEQFIVQWVQANGQPPTDEEVFAYVTEQQTLQLTAELNEARRDPWSR